MRERSHPCTTLEPATCSVHAAKNPDVSVRAHPLRKPRLPSAPRAAAPAPPRQRRSLKSDARAGRRRATQSSSAAARGGFLPLPFISRFLFLPPFLAPA
eukprot:6428914-Prymnesium_polylepis.1